MTRLQRLLCASLKAHLDGGRAMPPEGSGILWRAFLALSRTRGFSANGPCPISFAEIEAWMRLTRTPLEPHHVETLMAMDEVWMAKVYERQSLPEGVKALPQRSSEAMTPALFDLALGPL
ncbi:phage tail assembly chaperone [Alterinioella nitratireducens]|uniref:phage tail assembly chaperone n=1 Tax=Alterinioella nitratireducens TaxID=2735915 RepID=UPI00405930ED